MDFGGRYRVAAPRIAVWAALNDTEVLKAAIPGCHRIDWTSETALELEIKVNLGVVHPVFKGDLELSGIVPAQRYTLSGKGKGGLLGLAEGSADIILSDSGDATLLVFAAQGGASGQLMRLGKAIIGNSAQKVIDGFFERFGVAMGAEVTPLERDVTPS
ncbi:CoxG family protein [Devosia sp. A449]